MPRLDSTHLQLPPRYLAMVQDILQQHLPQAEVWAYGSRVMGGSYEASDLDLVARQPDDLLQPISLFEVREVFVESDLPIQVQIVDWAKASLSFHDEIEAGYVVLKEAN